MRIDVVINDKLMRDALESSGYKTKKDTIEAGLRLFVQFNRISMIRKFRGKLKWTGGLEEMRKDDYQVEINPAL